MREDARLFVVQGIRIMAGDKPVGFAKEGTITCSIEDDINIVTVDDGQNTASDWSGSYEINGNATIIGEQAELLRKLAEGLKISRKERRRMFHAVTHGGALVVPCRINIERDGRMDTHERYVWITRPSVLRRMIAELGGRRFQYEIINGYKAVVAKALSHVDHCSAGMMVLQHFDSECKAECGYVGCVGLLAD